MFSKYFKQIFNKSEHSSFDDSAVMTKKAKSNNKTKDTYNINKNNFNNNVHGSQNFTPTADIEVLNNSNNTVYEGQSKDVFKEKSSKKLDKVVSESKEEMTGFIKFRYIFKAY